MRVTLIAQFFPPETFAGANRIAAMTDALAAAADVQVVTISPSYPHPALYSADDVAAVRVNERVAIRRRGSFSPHGTGLVARAIGEQRMAAGLLATASRYPADVVVASSPGMFIGPAALALARLRGVPFVWDIRDVTWTYAREQAAGNTVRVAAAALERGMWAAARRADLLVAATSGIGRQLAARRLGPAVLTVENGVGSELLRQLDPGPPPPSSRPIVAYAGLVGRAQALEVLCDVAALAPEIDFVVAGDGPERLAIEAESARRGLGNLVFRGYLTPNELGTLYHRASVLFAQLHQSELHTVTALPSKLHEYMAAARPVVYAGNGLAAETITAIGSGIAVEPGDARAIAGAIRDLVADPTRAGDAGAAGRAFVEKRPSRHEAMTPLVEAVERLAERAAR